MTRAKHRLVIPYVEETEFFQRMLAVLSHESDGTLVQNVLDACMIALKTQGDLSRFHGF
jgi:hypothetical protein